MRNYWFLGVMLVPGLLAAQSARLTFAADTLAIGRPAEARLEIVHPASMTVIFPAAAEAFAPFEYLSAAAEPTATHGGQSRDVAIYQVSSFEMADSQQLSLPWAYVTAQGDTVVQRASSNLLRLQRRSQPNDTTLRADRAALHLSDEPDYVILGLLMLLVLVVLGVAGALARKPLMRWYAQRHIRAHWKTVDQRWAALKNKTNNPAEFLEELAHLWKEYIDLGVRPPLRSFTTPELEVIIRRRAELLPEQKEALINNSRWADEVIYAQKPAPTDDKLLEIHTIIRTVLKESYIRRKAKVQ